MVMYVHDYLLWLEVTNEPYAVQQFRNLRRETCFDVLFSCSFLFGIMPFSHFRITLQV